jgi:hypothetical protein
MDVAATSNYLQGYLIDLSARFITSLQTTLTDNPKAALHWAADVRSLVEANGRALTSGAPARFAEWPEAITAEQGAAEFRQYMTGFAAGLRAWPAAFEVARARAPGWIGQA